VAVHFRLTATKLIVHEEMLQAPHDNQRARISEVACSRFPAAAQQRVN